MVVCHCVVINDAVLRRHISAGDVTVDQVAARCNAGSRCGGCVPMIEALIREAGPVGTVRVSVDAG